MKLTNRERVGVKIEEQLRAKPEIGPRLLRDFSRAIFPSEVKAEDGSKRSGAIRTDDLYTVVRKTR